MKRLLAGAMLLGMCIWTLLTATAGAAEEKQVLRVGMEVNSAPFNWSQSDDRNDAVPVANSPGEFANGYDVEVARMLADGLDMELEILKVEWDGLIAGVMTGKFDAIIAGMTPTEERWEQIDFTADYYASELVMLVQEDGPLAGATRLDDFSGYDVTAQLNTSTYVNLPQIPDANILPGMDTIPNLAVALQTGKIDAFCTERPIGQAVARTNPGLKMILFEEGQGFVLEHGDTSVAVGLAKDSPLRAPMNEILEDFERDDWNRVMDEMVELQLEMEGVTQPGFGARVVDMIRTYGQMFLRGAGVTMLISLVGTVIGLLIGLLVAVLRTIPLRKKHRLRNAVLRILRAILGFYVEIFRGTPMMVQSMVIYYGSQSLFNIDMQAMTAAYIIVSINTGAYLAEIVRGGISSIDPGQTEAAKAIGMNHRQTMSAIILPQTFRTILPGIGNEFVNNIKDTSVLNVISVTELFFVTKSIAGSTYQIFEAYLIVSIVYIVLTFTVTRLLRLLEHRLEGPKSYSLVGANVLSIDPRVRSGRHR